MASAKRARKKKSADYPQMIFRITQVDKDRISRLIQEIKHLSNRDLDKSVDFVTTKKDITVNALLLGLELEKKRLLAKKGKQI